MSVPFSDTALPEQAFDDFEMGLLPVLRRFLLSCDTPESGAWQQAYCIAAERWGEAIGLPAAQSLMKVVRAVLDCRDGSFSYNDPYDLEARGRVTADEAALLRMLHHMRRDDTREARPAVADAAGGIMDPHVIRSGLAFASRFSAGQTAGRIQPSRLRVVA